MRSTTGISRRDFVQLSGLAAIGLTVGTPGRADDKPAKTPDADGALAQLLEGNKRFSKGELAHPRRKPEDFVPLAEGQNPIAVIIGCADSRVAPELVFDQGVGDLFVVRVAGNVVSGAGALVKGSIEYAIAELNVPLIMVLGHSQCGAVKSAIKHLGAKDALPGSIAGLVEAIQPAVAQVQGKPGDLLENAIQANVQKGVQRLRTLEPILAGPIAKGKVKVVGAIYELRSGKVTVLD